MKKSVLALLLAVGFAFTANAQEKEPNCGLSFGFQLNQYQKDFGMGLQVTSPFFAYEKIAFRVRANLMFNEHLEGEGFIPNNYTVTWTPYTNVSIGAIGKATDIGDFMRLYGEGGLIAILPNSDFSDEDIVLGGYGLFGFEFFFIPQGSYFIEIGGVGTGARAEKTLGQPIYSNGLTISTGLRITL